MPSVTQTGVAYVSKGITLASIGDVYEIPADSGRRFFAIEDEASPGATGCSIAFGEAPATADFMDILDGREHTYFPAPTAKITIKATVAAVTFVVYSDGLKGAAITAV